MVRINHYETVLNQFLSSRESHPEESGKKVPVDTNQLPLGGIKVVNAAVMVFDIQNSSKIMEDLSEKQYIEWLGIALHLFFHCVDESKGVVDKYTGDGAMVSFSLGNPQERCSNALECALRISEILHKLLNPYYSRSGFPNMNLRIGLDFGEVRIEKIGKRALSHLIIIGGAANIAKRLEEQGKNVEFDHNTTICVGYDFLYHLPDSDKFNNNGSSLYHKIGDFKSSKSEMDSTSPYPMYKYTGRYR